MSLLRDVDPLAPMLEPEPVVEPEPIVELELPEVVPLAPMPELEPLPDVPLDVVPDVAPAVPPPAGVPVAPIGVSWLLCWPAPRAGSAAVGLGGVLCAMAAPEMATAARPASRPLRVDEAIM
jgi:hypothetical protein